MATLGRPRSFDRDEALRLAMRLFWERGYEAVSLADLTAELGINKPSLYAAFGCKEALFREAVALYSKTGGDLTAQALREQPTARTAVEAMLRNNARAYVAKGQPRGCMVVLAASVGSSENAEVRAFLSDIRQQAQQQLEQRITRGIAEGDVPKGASAARVASFYMTVMQGLSIQARDGATVELMNLVIDGALSAWDTVAAEAPKASTEPGRKRTRT